MQHQNSKVIVPSSTTQLTPMAQKLLDLLQEQDNWINRSDLASNLNKSTLNKWDVILLSRLAENDSIETRKVAHHGPIGNEWQYRAIQLDLDSEKNV